MLRQFGPDNLPFQHDQLLAQKQVLGNELALASLQIRNDTHDLITFGWLGPLLES